MANKDRKKPRSIVRFPAKIVLPQEKTHGDCMVVDISVTGSRIHLHEKTLLPQKFILSIHLFPDIPPIQIKSRRVWRNRDLAGVHFETMSRRDYSVLDALVKIHRGEMKQPDSKSL